MNKVKLEKENNNFFRTLKIAKTEFKNQFNISKIFVALIIIVVALLGPIIQLSVRDIETLQQQKLIKIVSKIPQTIKDSLNITNSTHIDDGVLKQIIDFLKNNSNLLPKNLNISIPALEAATISSLSFNMLSQIFATSILYALAQRIFSIIKNKNSADRNRIMYINYNKNTVLFFKLLMSSFMFMFIVGGADSIGIFLVKIVGKGYINANITKQLLTQLFGIFVFYWFIQIFLHFILSYINSKKIKAISIASWLLSTAFLYIILSIVLGVRRELNDVIVNNVYVFSFIPIINIVVLPLVLYGIIPLWTIIPISIQMIIAIGLIWKPTASSVKNYLCS
ncbi:MAG: hypothetical protein GY679_03575 [Mycoplasma sp.]|nr:hypothetical protein [Mycoplasma sp.]